MSTELLAPAGSLESLKAVICAGADAVYIGGSKFGARAYADNPDEDALIQGLEFAHLRGRKVYLTVNTLLKENELDQLYDYILPYYQHGLDAVLVQDFGVLRYLHEHFPQLELHASTQMTITGPQSANDLKAYGVTRVVPARELSVPELKRIKDDTGLEVEVFIHGALCVCYSGQCLYSSMIGGRSGNRGRCAQPCRLLYLMDDKSGFHGKTSILEKPEARHFLSPKDLNGINAIGELVVSGMDSLKIEGRMKRPEYAAGVVSIYRKYLDLALAGTPSKVSSADQKKLYDLYNRTGFTDGYLHRHNGPEMMAPVKHELTGQETQARHQLYDQMHELYLTQELKVPATAYVSVRSNQPLTLTLLSGEHTVQVSGDMVQTAQNRPLTAERIEEQMQKFGDSDFCLEGLYVETDEASFVPLRALNELRRCGIDALRTELLKDFRREVPKPRRESIGRTQSKCSVGSDLPALSVLVSTDEQFRAALDTDGIDEIYLESNLLHRTDQGLYEAAQSFLEDCQHHHKRASIAMPYIDRSGSEEPELKACAKELIDAGLHTFLIRSYETLAAFTRAGLNEHVRADAGIYTYNHSAQEFLEDHQVHRFTAPVELNKKELFRRQNRQSEVIAYGRLPLMVTAQCLEKNSSRCNHAGAEHLLTDRMGVSFPTRCICAYCYNLIYNSVPLSLLSEIRTLRDMGFDALRLQMTTETEAEARAVLRLAVQNLRSGSQEEIAGAHTKGHFQRGVE